MYNFHTLPVAMCTWIDVPGELARFIPSISANAVNFQTYQMEGITHWNVLRASHRQPQQPTENIQFSLQHKVCYHYHACT